jgi:hypothetical protein
MVLSVASTVTPLASATAQAAAAPGSTTPNTGSGANSWAKASKAVAEAVLHATTKALIPRCTKAPAA